MAKLDFKKILKPLYHPGAHAVALVDVPALNYLMIDGVGDPRGSMTYADAVASLFAVAYTLKFMVKRGPSAVDYAVMPLEGLWWADDMAAFTVDDRSRWRWTLMIMQPSPVTAALVDVAVTEARKKRDGAALSRIRFESLREGLCAQVMHVGPFSAEGPTVARLQTFIDARGTRSGKHREIYLSDIRKAAPERWKTVIRQPLIRSR